ncbi:LacI family DNA-binding transcriptional regulator [Microbacterium esteraromaticum]|uniref:LacI family DNA-binding transcriptional regulator n=1 Tax=Microbacterium esteraromaticum TaxID=57043 RepID=UPI0019D3F411|nr:LacI family DNA-binding transcriptional regulator [Microbacterium esteraromaticum]MBN7793882.1 LacI family DNA-binding transcriptional regulator [Microbacterium esteraromaticum]
MAKVTIYSIAEELGVHPSTVSRAFSRPELVKDDVRERILAVAQRLGFQPNRTARRLATGSTGSVGLLVPDITNPFFPPLVRAIQQAAGDDTVILVDAEGEADREPSLIARLRAQVDGVILASPRSADRVLLDALDTTPAVVVNRIVPPLPSIVGDVSDALRAAGDHLTALGHSRLAIITGPAGSWAASARRDAVRAWAESSPVELIELGPFDATYEGGRAGAAALLNTDATAAFAFDDLTACGVIAGLADAGMTVPDDFSIVGCDDVLLAQVVTPTLSTISMPTVRLADVAVGMLRATDVGEAYEPTHLPGAFVTRGSTAPRS